MIWTHMLKIPIQGTKSVIITSVRHPGQGRDHRICVFEIAEGLELRELAKTWQTWFPRAKALKPRCHGYRKQITVVGDRHPNLKFSIKNLPT